MPAAPDALPFVDRHEVLVAAPPRVVWDALPGVGATVPGFRVAEAAPERHLLLTGRHAFSRYALGFTLEPAVGGTLLGATTHAEFPGALGLLYRVAVIGSGTHGLIVPRMLRAVRRRAERAAAS
ncbi:MAG: hypothetical protein K0S40_4789 [Actinomycetospora sp.]|nr:hypothetical protein [Actinomycetospora sp.]